jgi:hypothetical protein
VSVLFALVVSLCAAVAAVLFVTMWLDGDAVAVEVARKDFYPEAAA